MYADFQEEAVKNPQKIGEWLKLARNVEAQSNDLYKYIGDYKYQILKIADKDKADKNAVKYYCTRQPGSRQVNTHWLADTIKN